MCCAFDRGDAGAPHESAAPGSVRVYGPSDSGKTTLIELLIPLVTERGIRVATIKHAHHGFELDRPGKDSWRHTRAGACATAIIGPTKSALLMQTDVEMPVQRMVDLFTGTADIVLVEGFKRGDGPAVVIDTDHHGGESVAAGVTVDGDRCVIGTPPWELSPAQLSTVVDFLTTAAGR